MAQPQVSSDSQLIRLWISSHIETVIMRKQTPMSSSRLKCEGHRKTPVSAGCTVRSIMNPAVALVCGAYSMYNRSCTWVPRMRSVKVAIAPAA